MLNIIKASAGSGKTFTLALEYITLLLGETTEDGSLRLYKGKRKREYHRHILAVTFTNKATEEMKQRIVKELSILAGLRKEKDNYLDTLCARFNASVDEIRAAAKRALTELLFDYSNFNVSTIDSFFQIILRTFAAEVELPYDYDIELNDDYALAVGVHDFLNLLRSDSTNYTQVLGWLNNYVNAQLQSGEANWNPFKAGNSQASNQQFPANKSDSLFSIAGIINKEIFRKVHNEMSTYLTDNRGSLMQFQTKLEARSEELLSDIRSLIARTYQLISTNYPDDVKKSGCVASWISKSTDKDFIPDWDNMENFRRYANDGASNYRTSKKIDESVIRQLDMEINGNGKEIIARIDEFCLLKAVLQNIYKLGLLAYINRCVNDFRNENNLILLSDTNSLLNDIIGEDDTPFIYERIGTSVNNFLIDEFQDTSELQWHNMEPMLRNSLGNGYFNLIIGDEKQCIYRFRNSDPSLLQSKVGNELQQWVNPSTDKNRNWRSTPNVVKFNNTFFTHLAKKLNLSNIYANVVQLYKPNQAIEGYVKITMLDKLLVEDVINRTINLICDIIDRGYRQSDIAILVDRNAQGATIIQEILEYNKSEERRHTINVVSNEALLLNNSPSVRLVVSYLRHIALKTSIPESIDETTRKRSFNERLHTILRQYEEQLNQGIEPGDALDKCFDNANDTSITDNDISDFLPRESESFSLVSVVERIIERVSKEALSRENAFLQAFQDVVIDFCSRSCGTLISFLRWWDRKCDKLSIASPEGIDAVNVMTIHKSKGLEFGCVILPFANWDIGKIDNTMWFTHDEVKGAFKNIDESFIPPLLPVKSAKHLIHTKLKDPFGVQLKQTESDCLNKTYVAFTRAVDELYIFTEDKRDKDSDSLTKSLSFYLSDFCSTSNETEAAKLNHEYSPNAPADVATCVKAFVEVQDFIDDNSKIESKETQCYEVGTTNNKKPSDTTEKVQPVHMPDYHVTNRHELAKYKLPDVLYTHEREMGILYHKILSMVRSTHDLDRVLRHCTVRYILPLDATERDSIIANIRSMLTQSDEVASWFAPGNRVYNERPILDGKNRPRPDRIITTPDGRTIVIDYKFGEPHHLSHSRQVKNYMTLLSQAGFDRVEGRIWYPFEHSIVEVK
ncbi:MAG: UvrD-helicase domain-containing protein [Muribaculaceae bacterium]